MKIFFILTSLIFIFSCSSVRMIPTSHRTSPKKTSEAKPTTTPMAMPSPEPVPQVATAAPAPTPTPAAPVPVSSRLLPIPKIKPTSDKVFETDPKKIGVILPLSGKNATISQRALSAIRLGLKINGSSDFSLALYDSQGNPELAAKGVEKLLQEDHVVALLGGLGAKEAVAIASRAEFFQVPFFTFSQKSDLTSEAKYTFRNAVTPAMQTSKLVEFAIQKLGYKKFAVLYPNDAYGVEFANQFWDHVLAYGGTIVAAQVYDPKEADLTTYIQKMVGTYYVENRPEEYKSKLDQIKDKKRKKAAANGQATPKKSRENEAKENLLEPIVDFDAIFIPDSSKAMGQAIGFFRASDVTQMTYLGTNLWNTEDLVRRANQTSTNNNNRFYFVDNVINEDQRKRSDFNSQFSAAYHEEPSIIEVQTYESAKILRDLLNSGIRDRYSLANRLKELGHTQGAFAEIYMNNSNELVRDLSVLSLENGSITPQ